MRTATVHQLPVPAKLRCEGCGTLADAACDCGVAYVPVKPAVAAAKAVAANPHKSDRAIAAEIGVDHKTVSKARRSTGEKSPVEAEARIGRDGKARKVPSERVRSPTAKQMEEYWHQQIANECKVWLAEHPGRTSADYTALLHDPKFPKNELGHWRGVKSQAEDEAMRRDWLIEHPGSGPLPEHECQLDDEAGRWVDEYRRRPAMPAAVPTPDLSASAQQRLEAHKRKVERELQAEFTERVRLAAVAEADLIVTYMLERARKVEHENRTIVKLARDMVRRNGGLLTKASFNAIRSCLHTDSRQSASEEKLNRAFHAFSALEKLVAEDQSPEPSDVPPLPSRSELEAIKRKVAEARKARRQGGAAPAVRETRC